MVTDLHYLTLLNMDSDQDLSNLLNDIVIKEVIICHHCRTSDVEYRVIKTKKMAKQCMTHVGAYCIHCKRWLKWVHATPDIISKAKKPITLF